jgi:hypothetical protein
VENEWINLAPTSIEGGKHDGRGWKILEFRGFLRPAGLWLFLEPLLGLLKS